MRSGSGSGTKINKTTVYKLFWQLMAIVGNLMFTDAILTGALTLAITRDLTIHCVELCGKMVCVMIE